MKYKFSKNKNFWNQDHRDNFILIQNEFRYKDDLYFLEIGVYEAWTSVKLLEDVLTGDNNRLCCIDPSITKNGRHNLRFHKDRVVLIEDYSDSVLLNMISLKRFVFDFIYVDGDHNASSVLTDLILAWRLLKVGGIMLIDDYEMKTLDPWFYTSHKEFSNDNPRLNFTHPRLAIDPFLTIYRGQYQMLANNYQICIRKTIDLRSPEITAIF